MNIKLATIARPDFLPAYRALCEDPLPAHVWYRLATSGKAIEAALESFNAIVARIREKYGRKESDILRDCIAHLKSDESSQFRSAQLEKRLAKITASGQDNFQIDMGDALAVSNSEAEIKELLEKEEVALTLTKKIKLDAKTKLNALMMLPLLELIEPPEDETDVNQTLK